MPRVAAAQVSGAAVGGTGDDEEAGGAPLAPTDGDDDSIARLTRRAGSPMSRAASWAASIAARSGAISWNCGAMRQWRAHRILVSAWVLRELRSRAIERGPAAGYGSPA